MLSEQRSAHGAVRPRAIGDTRRTRRSAHVEPPPYRQIVFCGKAIIQLNLCRERSRFVLSVGFCAPLFRKLMRNGFHYVPYKRYYSNPLRMRLFREKGNERKFVFVIACFGTYIDLNKIDIDINFLSNSIFHYVYTCDSRKSLRLRPLNFRKIMSPCSL